jgi:hypothetical protein
MVGNATKRGNSNELSAELFETTLHRITGDGGTGGAERRLSPRVGLRCKIKLHPVKHGVMGTPVFVWTRDISRCGIGVMSFKKMTQGETYLLMLPSEAEGTRRVLYCTVRNCQPMMTGIFAVGLSFEALQGREAA